MKTIRDLPPLNALRAFEATARLESVSRAAQELHVTHGAVSRQLHALEDAVGQPLFVRQGRGLGLTSAGEQLRDNATDAFERLRDCWASLRRGSEQAPFVLACPGSLLARWVIPRLDQLGRDLPELKLHLAAQEEPFSPALSSLGVALMLASPPFPVAWQVYELAPEWIGPVVSPRYAGMVPLQTQPSSVLQQELLLHTTSRPQAWPDWAQAEGIAFDSLHYGQGFAHLYYLLEAAVAGLGVAIAPRQLVADDLVAGRLLAPWGFQQTTASWILAAPRRGNDKRLDALANWLRQALASDRPSLP